MLHHSELCFLLKVWWGPSSLPSLSWAARWWSGPPGTPQASWEACPPWPCVLPAKSSSTWAAPWRSASEWSLPLLLVSVAHFNIVSAPTLWLYVTVSIRVGRLMDFKWKSDFSVWTIFKKRNSENREIFLLLQLLSCSLSRQVFLRDAQRCNTHVIPVLSQLKWHLVWRWHKDDSFAPKFLFSILVILSAFTKLIQTIVALTHSTQDCPS